MKILPLHHISYVRGITTDQANVKAVTSAHCPQCKMVTALIGNEKNT